MVKAILNRARVNPPEKATSEDGIEKNFSYIRQIIKIRRIIYGMRLAILCQRPILVFI